MSEQKMKKYKIVNPMREVNGFLNELDDSGHCFEYTLCLDVEAETFKQAAEAAYRSSGDDWYFSVLDDAFYIEYVDGHYVQEVKQ